MGSVSLGINTYNGVCGVYDHAVVGNTTHLIVGVDSETTQDPTTCGDLSTAEEARRTSEGSGGMAAKRAGL